LLPRSRRSARVPAKRRRPDAAQVHGGREPRVGIRRPLVDSARLLEPRLDAAPAAAARRAGLARPGAGGVDPAVPVDRREPDVAAGGGRRAPALVVAAVLRAPGQLPAHPVAPAPAGARPPPRRPRPPP